MVVTLLSIFQVATSFNHFIEFGLEEIVITSYCEQGRSIESIKWLKEVATWKIESKVTTIYRHTHFCTANKNLFIECLPEGQTSNIKIRKATEKSCHIKLEESINANVSKMMRSHDKKATFFFDQGAKKIIRSEFSRPIHFEEFGFKEGFELPEIAMKDLGLLPFLALYLMRDYMLVILGSTLYKYWFKPRKIAALATLNVVSGTQKHFGHFWGGGANAKNENLETILSTECIFKLTPSDKRFFILTKSASNTRMIIVRRYIEKDNDICDVEEVGKIMIPTYCPAREAKYYKIQRNLLAHYSMNKKVQMMQLISLNDLKVIRTFNCGIVKNKVNPSGEMPILHIRKVHYCMVGIETWWDKSSHFKMVAIHNNRFYDLSPKTSSNDFGRYLSVNSLGCNGSALIVKGFEYESRTSFIYCLLFK